MEVLDLVLNGVLTGAPHLKCGANIEKQDCRQGVWHVEIVDVIQVPTAEEILDLADRIGADLVETTSRGKRLADYPTPTDVVEDLPGLNPTMTSDAHSVEELEEHADNHVIVEVPELTGDTVIRALKRGNYSLSTQY